MSPRKGRPTNEPKTLSTRIRLSEEDIERLEYCCQELSVSKSEVIRIGIKKIYEELKK